MPDHQTSSLPPAVELATATWKRISTERFDVAILPWGATEAHNYHLPYGTDTLHASWVAIAAARLAAERGARIIVLPAIPFGVNTGQLDIPLTINMNPSTQAAVLGDIVDSLSRHGIRKLVIFNGHGGNDFRQMVRELQPRYPDLLLCVLNWYQVGQWEDFFEEPGDHAGEMETSVMLHIAPSLVLPLTEAGDGASKIPRIPALRQRWAWTPRRWTSVTRDTGIGDPRKATAAKGKAYVDHAIGEIASFLSDLAATDPAQLYTA
jgi:creatinine amidohydrolase